MNYFLRLTLVQYYLKKLKMQMVNWFAETVKTLKLWSILTSSSFDKTSEQFHFYHLVDKSHWPYLTSIGAFAFMSGLTMWMHKFFIGSIVLFLGLFLILYISAMWWSDVMSEGFFLGAHTKKVKNGLSLGMMLFIMSEVLFFMSFFWTFFHSSLNPSIVLGSVWPPMGMNMIEPFKMPLLNTMILLVSGITLTFSHHSMKNIYSLKNFYSMYAYFFTSNVCYPTLKNMVNFYYYMPEKYAYNGVWSGLYHKVWLLSSSSYIMPVNNALSKSMNYEFKKTWYHGCAITNITLYKVNFESMENLKNGLIGLFLTMLLGLEFTVWQLYEYFNANFYLFDGIYGSTFYMTTGLHGMHVLMGTIFLVICLIRMYFGQLLSKSHVGFESAMWYWHFVDVVWIFVFLSLYCWAAGL